MLYKTETELMKKAKEAIGKTFNEIDQNNRLGKGQKGALVILSRKAILVMR